MPMKWHCLVELLGSKKHLEVIRLKQSPSIVLPTLDTYICRRRDELLPVLSVAEIRTRTYGLGFHFFEGCSDISESPTTSCKKPLKGVEMKSVPCLALQKARQVAWFEEAGEGSTKQ